ncbi:hypothetical protein [Sphingobium sp. LSP13-1-1.1]|uniref:hypothetical protein n=1 Tax=Sphingobium sp. LSP13-1-1.1 TaxID=3135234 RepID=UPI003414CEC4
MSEVLTIALPAALGVVGTLGVQWLQGRSQRHQVDIDAEVKLDAQRDGLTFQLLETARSEMSQLMAEVRELRPLTKTGVYLEEALDHLHALLHAEGDEELRAAHRRAAAFLRRMRGQDSKGEKRNAVQTAISAQRIVNDAKGGRS